MRLKAGLGALCAATVLVCAGGAEATEPNAGMTVDQLRQLTQVSQAVISPDGRQVPYVTRMSLWLLAREGKAPPRRFVRDEASLHSVAFTPDSKGVTFFSKRGAKHARVWTLPVDGDEAQALTSAPDGVRSYAVSPDGTRAAYITRAPADAGQTERTAQAKKGHDANVASATPRHFRVMATSLGGTERTMDACRSASPKRSMRRWITRRSRASGSPIPERGTG